MATYHSSQEVACIWGVLFVFFMFFSSSHFLFSFSFNRKRMCITFEHCGSPCVRTQCRIYTILRMMTFFIFNAFRIKTFVSICWRCHYYYYCHALTNRIHNAISFTELAPFSWNAFLSYASLQCQPILSFFLCSRCKYAVRLDQTFISIQPFQFWSLLFISCCLFMF